MRVRTWVASAAKGLADQHSRVRAGHTDEHIVPLEPRAALQDRAEVVPGGEHPEHVLDCKAAPTHDRLAAEDFGVRRDSFQEFVFARSMAPAAVTRRGETLDGHTPSALEERNREYARLGTFDRIPRTSRPEADP
jgi:hypothetical protein